ncbi:YceI family protein [Alteromonas sediminis]|uniref:YceI family protein n=1 Tax=Alteromonas sediminis TaxID=2259342 RepID=A0A3N5Z635_9ALTE|nr:YceI family protein [Alteromonas sediminis]RPJ65934.1 YceI family protein [Alteromonas sediminis]
MKSFSYVVIIFVSMMSTHVHALQLDADSSNATLSFSGQHAGMTFTGVFERWQSQLILPPNQEPSIKAEFILASAKTGDSTYDETLPEEDWFHVEKFPVARFISTQINLLVDGYRVEGTLELKGKGLPIIFNLHNREDKLIGNFDVDRLAYGIGLESDPGAEWVSQNIRLSLTINL